MIFRGLHSAHNIIILCAQVVILWEQVISAHNLSVEIDRKFVVFSVSFWTLPGSKEKIPCGKIKNVCEINFPQP